MKIDFEQIDWEKIWEATYETFYMTIISVAATFVLGIILGLLLYLTDKDGIWQNKMLNFITATLVNVFRAITFIILILLLFPFTDFLIGTIRGPKAALQTLIIGGSTLYRRIVENDINVDEE